LLGRVATEILDAAMFQSARPLTGILSLITFLPTLAVAVRRLHDVDRSGWWLLLDFTIIGMFYPLLVWRCRKGTEGANRFGPDSSGLDSRLANVFS
jgi:uncharacterized membrane protein YhaH (DUF805 family)